MRLVKAFKVNVVNRALTSLHGGSLEITRTVRLVRRWKMLISERIKNACVIVSLGKLGLCT